MSEADTTHDEDEQLDVADVAALVMAIEPALRDQGVDAVIAALATLLCSAFSQKAMTATAHSDLCDWLLAGLKTDRLGRYGPTATTRVQ